MTELCGCCETDTPGTPLRVENRPGLSALAYRIGTYGAFRDAMLQQIAAVPELAALATRQSDDYAITLLELWAAVADVLTFYQERYANEAYLRTATQRESVGRLARLLDYALRSGTAATAWLAFTLDAGKALALPVGLGVQSTPEQNQTPQTFETLEPLDADYRFNRLDILPAPVAINPLAAGRSGATLNRTQGPALASARRIGDSVVLFNNGATTPTEIKKIAALSVTGDRVWLEWEDPIQGASWNAGTQAVAFARTFRLFGQNAPPSVTLPTVIGGVTSKIKWDFATLAAGDFRYPQGAAANTSVIAFDTHVDRLEAGRSLLVDDLNGVKTQVTIVSVEQAAETLNTTINGASRTAFADTVTRVTVTPAVPALSDRRRALIYELVGDPITFWDQAYPDALTDVTVYLSGRKINDADGEGVEVGRAIERGAFKPGVILRPKEFAPGRAVLLSDGDTVPILARIHAAPTITTPDASGFCHFVLPLESDSTLALQTATAALFGNVAFAGHGETVRPETVGNGDGHTKFRQFALKKTPLTRTPDASGLKSSLTLTVNGVRWTEVPGLYGQPPTAQVYATRLQDDGTTTLQFGDGVTGAIPPAGRGNLIATYRVGLGRAGRLPADRLTTLLDRPTGLKTATNPLPAQGGADPEARDDARQNAPRTVRTFGRAVSLRDFEDLIKESGEVAKARATWVWDGYARAIHLTLAGQDGGTFDDTSLRRLGAALQKARDPNHRLRLANYVPVAIRLDALLRVDAAYSQANTVKAARDAVTAFFAFDGRELGEAVHLSDLYRSLQEVPGVVSVDINLLNFKRPTGLTDPQFLAYLQARGVTFQGGVPEPVQGHLRIYPALPDPARPGVVLPAELAWLETPAQDATLTAEGGITA